MYRVLVAYDGSEPSERALEMVSRMVVNDTDMEVILVHVVLLFSSGAAATGIDTVLLDDVSPIQDKLQSIAGSLTSNARIKILRGSSPADLIVRCAIEEECDLIIMGSRGRGGVKGYLGSVSYAVVKDSPISVLIAK